MAGLTLQQLQQMGAKPATTTGGLTLDQIKQKQSGGFRFDVPEAPKERENRIARYQQEAQQAQKESEKANSVMGKIGNFGKAFVGTIANSEVGLGQSLAKIIGAGDTTLTDAQKLSSDTEVALLKQINKAKGEGRDTTKLQQEYNRLKGGQGEVNALVGEQFNFPSTSKVVGQMGGTALDLLTAGTYGKATQGMKFGVKASPVSSLVQKSAVASGIPELAPIAGQKASGLFTKKGLGNVAVGTGIGYASDVSQGLQGARGEDRTGGKAFIPGAGTALGFALPAVSETAQSVKNVRSGQYDVQRRSNALDDIGKRYGKVGDALEMGSQKGVDVRKILSETNILNGAVDEDGLITAKPALENFDKLMEPYENKVREAVQKEGAKVRISDIANTMDDFLTKSNLQGGAQTKLSNELMSDLRGLQSRYGDNIPVEALHDIKIFRGSASNYADTGANIINKEATRFFKEAVENNTRSFDVAGYNKGLSKLYSIQDVIEALDKKRVKGGRLGKMFASGIGAVVGGTTGNPFMSILGAEFGRRAQGNILESALGGDIAKSLEIPKELTEILATKVPRKDVIPPVVIPKKKDIGTLNLQSNKEGSLKTNQPTTTSIPIKAIPQTVLPIKEVSSKASVKTVIPESAFSKSNDLATEAKKYKSAEEFVKAQDSKTYYHTTSKDVAPSIEKDGFKAHVGERSMGTTNGSGVFMYEDISPTKEFSKNIVWKGKEPTVIESKINGKIFNSKSQSKSINALAEDTALIEKLKSEGYVGIRGTENGTPVTFVFDTNAIKTKSQLTDIWEKANRTGGGLGSITVKKKDVPLVKEISDTPTKKEISKLKKILERAGYDYDQMKEDGFTDEQILKALEQ